MIPKKLIDRGQYWTDSLTLVSGCSPVSEGCAHCWSAGMASRFPWGKGFAKNGKWTGKVETNRKALAKLEKRAFSTRKLKPRVWQIWNDLFAAPAENIIHIFNLMETLEDVFLILTKRPERIAVATAPRIYTDNIYVGVSVESQKHIHRIDQLIQNWQGKKFVSIEPCLGAVDLSSDYLEHLDGVILGGESGSKARPMHPDWARSIRDQCQEAEVPFFFKQWGEWAPDCLCGGKKAHKSIARPKPGKLGVMFRCGKKKAGRLLDGRHWDQLAWNKKGADE